MACAISSRHLDIRDHHIGLQRHEALHPLLAIHRQMQTADMAAQKTRQQIARLVIVLDIQHRQGFQQIFAAFRLKIIQGIHAGITSAPRVRSN
jgi:hypothetical protein